MRRLTRFSTLANYLLSGAVLLALAVFVLQIAVSSSYQWDLRVFYAAPTTLATGANPYDFADANLNYRGLSFLYPPLTLYVFEPLTFFSYRMALLVWLTLKLAALASLLWIWHRHFEPLNASWPTVLFLAYAFNGPILKDIEFGNIALFEQVGLWIAFSFLVRDRTYAAGLILAVTAQFKLMPVLFLGLLLFMGPQPRWRPFLTSLGVFVGLFALNFLVLPDLTRQFFELFSASNHPNLDERGSINPSTLALVRDLAEKLAGKGLPIGAGFAELVYAACVAALALTTLGLLLLRPEFLSKNPRWAIYFACTLFAVAAPRMKDYSYVLLTLPGLYVAREFLRGHLRYASLFPLAILLVLPYAEFLKWLVPYTALLAAWCLLFYLVCLRFDEIWPEAPSMSGGSSTQGTQASV